MLLTPVDTSKCAKWEFPTATLTTALVQPSQEVPTRFFLALAYIFSIPLTAYLEETYSATFNSWVREPKNKSTLELKQT